MTTAIQEYSATEAALADLAQRYTGVIFDVATKEGMTAAKAGRAEIRGYRTALEAMRVDIKAPALERCRLIDAEAKRITEELVKLEKPIDDLIKADERRKAAEEEARVARLQAVLDGIKGAPALSAGKPSSYIRVAIERLPGLVIDGSYAEFEEAAQMARSSSVAQLELMFRTALDHEQEQERMKAERAELLRRAAEQDERDRKRHEEEAAARARIETQERESRQRIEAEQKAAREQREAEDARIRARQEELDRQARVIEDRKRAERMAAEDKERADRLEIERREREEQARQDAEASEIQRQKNEMLDARTMLDSFKLRFGHMKDFAGVVREIDKLTKKIGRAPARASGVGPGTGALSDQSRRP